MGVRIIAKRTLRDYWAKWPDAERPLNAWYRATKRAVWKTPAEVKAAYAKASIVGSDRVVFNIGGNKHRLIVAIFYDVGIVFVRFVGTHKEYDQIDAATV